MPKEIVLPELAESVVEGEILKWLVEEGESLSKNQPVVEVMTDKVTVELPSPYGGVLAKKLVKEGEVVKVRAPIAVVIEEGEIALAISPEAAVNQASNTGVQEERSIIELGLSVADSREKPSLFKLGDKREQAQNPITGAGMAVDAKGVMNPRKILAVPAARKLARELGIELSQIAKSGPNGCIRVEDVKRFAESQKAAHEGGKVVAYTRSSITPPEDFTGTGSYKSPKGYEALEERVPFRGLRRAIAQQMVASHLHTVRTLNVDEADFTELVVLRERLKPVAQAQGIKLSYLPFIFKAITLGLKKYPSLNSSLDEAKQEIVLKRYYHIGMAVATEAGLVVPVIRDVNKKNILELAGEISGMADKARAGKLLPQDIGGSSFSVTNIGSIGALFSFPIINVPDAAILGVHSLQKRPMVMPDDSIAVRHMMYLSLSFDHRLVDGADAARFCREIVRLLQNPELLILETV